MVLVFWQIFKVIDMVDMCFVIAQHPFHIVLQFLSRELPLLDTHGISGGHISSNSSLFPQYSVR